LFIVLFVSPSSAADRSLEECVTARSAIIMDWASGRVLWEKDADSPRYPASTTKILTSLLLLERTRPEERLTAPEGVQEIEGASLHLAPGEQISAHDALYAMMLRSANDVCVTVAHHLAGDVASFARLMNLRARELGCIRTHFRNPNGLNDDQHVTTARDLALIAREAMTHPEFRIAAKTQRFVVERPSGSPDRLLKTKNKYLAMDKTADGIKTGWTRDAGKCYVGSVTRGGFRVLTVVLDSQDWLADHQQMVSWAFRNFKLYSGRRAGTVLAEAPVSSGTVAKVPVALQRGLAMAVPTDAKGHVTEELEWLDPAGAKAPIPKGRVLGRLRLSDGAGFSVTAPLVAVASVDQASALARLDHWPSLVIIAAVLGGATIFMRSRSRTWGGTFRA
jgi:D-alanyl-D-alanine carboxypeptidase